MNEKKQSIVIICLLNLTLLRNEVICMDTQNAFYFPKPTGSFAVGSTAYHLIDSARKNEFGNDPLRPYRELMVQIWYPAQDAADAIQPTQYAPDAIAYWKEKLRATSIADTTQLISLDNIFVYEKKDASLTHAQGPFPLLIFSPGFAQMRTMNTALCEQVASYGYVVASIDYTYFSEHVRFPDGRVTLGNVQTVDSIEKEQHLMDMFIKDIAFVIKEMKILCGIDTNNIGIFGHSVGGSTALFATHAIPEIKAGLNIDGGIFGNKELLAYFNKPFMHIIAEQSKNWAHMIENLPDEQLMQYGFPSPDFRDAIVEKAQFMKEKLHANQKSDVYRIMIRGAGHMSFDDTIFLKDNPLLAQLLHVQFGIGTLSGQKVTELTTLIIVAFFDIYLKNKSDTAPIRKILAKYPEIEYENIC